MMALVPPLTNVGDEVCIVGGAAKPVLLRVKDEERGKHVLVGDCYVHGVMNGEKWGGGKLARTVTIC